jgi:excinuclease ABC subunit A
MVDRVMALPDGTRLYLLAPVVRGRKGEYRKELAEYLKKGFQRVKIDGQFYEIADAPVLDKKFKHDIDVVVDRLVVRGDLGPRLADSFETALKLADGMAVAEFADEGLSPRAGEVDARRVGAGISKSANTDKPRGLSRQQEREKKKRPPRSTTAAARSG